MSAPASSPLDGISAMESQKYMQGCPTPERKASWDLKTPITCYTPNPMTKRKILLCLAIPFLPLLYIACAISFLFSLLFKPRYGPASRQAPPE
jgi:hypothetical protein